jgi:hypothetical protein
MNFQICIPYSVTLCFVSVNSLEGRQVHDCLRTFILFIKITVS